MKRNFEISNCGNITSITAKTKKAAKWINDNVYFETWQVQGRSIMIDSRMAEDIIEAIEFSF
jgi:hypothetical protein